MGRLYFYEYLPARAEVVVGLLQSDPALVAGATEQARGRAEAMAGRLSFSIGRLEVAKQVKVSVGEMLLEPGAARFPIQWKAKSGTWFFPRMQAMLEVLALSDSPEECQLSLVGEYTPPLGTFGAITDLLLMHQVAEASVCAFVQGLKARLEQAIALQVLATSEAEAPSAGI
jgi:hypothetical protein